ncbi:putative dehydrogenase [Marinomonas alcarazii]|uniref:Putative dehydrogenase n=1 Tax=Marinomonas alcarazii TaxID=491949 RepID=A0A318V419_9GAMM|nr:Gfo/Idh/MocA family oxidoreductase [Marinomonas alcarazii]PYF80965.1 putative dehydrogenase [Marinomonas alcarazii]
MKTILNVGLIGCGNISDSYLSLAPQFCGFKILACADLNTELAVTKAQKYGIESRTVDQLLASQDIDIIVNLTIPAAHYAVSMQALEAGKHVYSEKPLVLSLEEGQKMKALSLKKGLKVGSAPDTFMGGSHQFARHLLDKGEIGEVYSGTCHVMSAGMESWHPNPDFFFKPGGGPILDLGPYYIANLIQLLGPVESVIAKTAIPRKQRKITSQPRSGEMIDVETPTTIHAILTFESGAVITLGASWDVKAHQHSHMELYGSKGSMYLPDPNFFGGKVSLIQDGRETPLQVWDHPFGVPNQIHGELAKANYRTAGLAEMVMAIHMGRDHMCALDRALHGVEVMTAILASGESGQSIKMTTHCDRPRALDPIAAKALLAACF